MRHLLWKLWRFLWGEPPGLYISNKRINEEVRVARRSIVDEDPEYRAKVKKRMMEGLTSRQLAPLINRERFMRQRRRHKNVMLFPKKRKES